MLTQLKTMTFESQSSEQAGTRGHSYLQSWSRVRVQRRYRSLEGSCVRTGIELNPRMGDGGHTGKSSKFIVRKEFKCITKVIRTGILLRGGGQQKGCGGSHLGPFGAAPLTL